MKPHVYEMIEVGERFGPLPLALDDHEIRAFAFAVEDHSALYFKSPRQCGPYAPPALLAKKLLHIFMTKYDPQGVSAVHTKDDIEFISPTSAGDTVTLAAEYTHTFVRKGRPSIVLAGEARDAAGNVLVRHRSIEIVPAEGTYQDRPLEAPQRLSQRRVDTTIPDRAAVVSRAEDVRGAGVVLPARSRTIHQDQMSVFVGANEGWRNIHTDLDVARAAGFDRPIMSGMIQACWFTQMMTDFFGAGYLSGGNLGITFLRNVASGDTVDLHAVVREVADDGTLGIEFWSTDEGGAPTAVGWATGNAKGSI